MLRVVGVTSPQIVHYRGTDDLLKEQKKENVMHVIARESGMLPSAYNISLTFYTTAAVMSIISNVLMK